MQYIIPIYMALAYRLRGHAWNTRPFGQLLYALPYGLVCYMLTGEIKLGVLSVTITTIMILKGHGNNMDLGNYIGRSDDEWYEFIIKPIKPYLNEYWYDVLGMAVSGLTYTLPSGLICGNLLLALSGATKALAYMIGWKVWNCTEAGEWLTGIFAGICLILILTGV